MKPLKQTTPPRPLGFPSRKIVADASVALIVSSLGYLAGLAKLGIEASKETKVALLPVLAGFILLQAIVIAVIYSRMRSYFRNESAEIRAQLETHYEQMIAELEAGHREEISKLEAGHKEETARLVAKHSEESTLIRDREFDLFRKRTDQHHKFVHFARDIAVKSMAPFPLIRLNPRLGEQPAFLDLKKHCEADVQKLLGCMTSMFKLLVPHDTKVWVCMRQLNHSGDYRTCIRTGDYDTRREENTENLPANAAIVRKLLNLINTNKECVLLTGRHDPDWHGTINDALGETESVLVGAILLKSFDHNRNWVDKQMGWLLCLCSDKEDTFNEGHKNLMKCCNDIISGLLNGWVRSGMPPTSLQNPPAPKKR